MQAPRMMRQARVHVETLKALWEPQAKVKMYVQCRIFQPAVVYEVLEKSLEALMGEMLRELYMMLVMLEVMSLPT